MYIIYNSMFAAIVGYRSRHAFCSYVSSPEKQEGNFYCISKCNAYTIEMQGGNDYALIGDYRSEEILW